jgi:hypothetical protein
LEALVALAALIAGSVRAFCFGSHGRESPHSVEPNVSAHGPERGEPPMRLSLFNLTPDEYAELAARFGPDGAARVAAALPKQSPVTLGVASGHARANRPSDARIDNGIPDRRPERANGTAPA